MSGFIAMQREALDHHLIGDAERFRAWFWLVANAAWKPTKVRIKGETVTLERGEMSFSVRFLADAWGWSKSRVDRFLSDLRDEGMIATRSKIGTPCGKNAGQGQSIITICNYAKYQSIGNDERDNSGTLSGTTAGQQRDKEEQVNKGTIEEEPIGPSSHAHDDCAEIVECWNAMVKDTRLSRCTKLTPKRRTSCKARLRDEGRDRIIQAIEHVPRSAFLRGDRGDWGGATFEFLIRPDSVTKILEGRYDDRPSNASNGQRDSRDGQTRAIDERLGLGGSSQPSSEAGRRADGDGGGYREFQPTRIATNR